MGPLGLLQTCTKQQSPSSKHHHNSTKGPRRDGRKNENCGGRGKKERNFGRSGGGGSGMGPRRVGLLVQVFRVQGFGVFWVTKIWPKHSKSVWTKSVKTLKHQFWPKLDNVGLGQSRFGQSRPGPSEHTPPTVNQTGNVQVPDVPDSHNWRLMRVRARCGARVGRRR